MAKQASLLPACVTTTLGALDQLAQAAGHLCSATNHLCATVDDAAAGIHDITVMMIKSQKEAMMANLAEA